MQHNMVIGNISNINRIEGTKKAFITVADHYNRYDATTKKFVPDVNYVPLEAFIPDGLDLVVGQLICATFRVVQYKDRDGKYKTACDVIDLDVRLNNISKEKREAAKNATQSQPQNAGEAENSAPAEAPAEGNAQMPFGEESSQAEAPAEAPAKKSGKKSAK